MSLSRFASLEAEDLIKLQTPQVKPNTAKAYNSKIKLFREFCDLKSPDLFNQLSSLPNSEVEELVCLYYGSVRKINKDYFKQKSFSLMTWAIKKFLRETCNYNVESSDKIGSVIKNINKQIIVSGRGGVKHVAKFRLL